MSKICAITERLQQTLHGNQQSADHTKKIKVHIECHPGQDSFQVFSDSKSLNLTFVASMHKLLDRG